MLLTGHLKELQKEAWNNWTMLSNGISPTAPRNKKWVLKNEELDKILGRLSQNGGEISLEFLEELGDIIGDKFEEHCSDGKISSINAMQITYLK